MWILPPVALVDRKVARNKGDGQADDTRNLETDVAAHGQPRSGTVDQEPGAYYCRGSEHEECECCEQRMEED